LLIHTLSFPNFGMGCQRCGNFLVSGLAVVDPCSLGTFCDSVSLSLTIEVFLLSFAALITAGWGDGVTIFVVAVVVGEIVGFAFVIVVVGGVIVNSIVVPGPSSWHGERRLIMFSVFVEVEVGLVLFGGGHLSALVVVFGDFAMIDCLDETTGFVFIVVG